MVIWDVFRTDLLTRLAITTYLLLSDAFIVKWKQWLLMQQPIMNVYFNSFSCLWCVLWSFLFHIILMFFMMWMRLNLQVILLKTFLYQNFMTCNIKSLTSGVLHTEDSYNWVNKTIGLWGEGKGKKTFLFCFVLFCLLFLRVPWKVLPFSCKTNVNKATKKENPVLQARPTQIFHLWRFLFFFLVC